ncbi:MAG: SDR family NAD(P)-dependent oxidoreductase, partial [Gammaproteobacteria bacterium]
GPCGAAAWALVRRNAPASGSASPSFDIDVCDLDGTVCVRMRGYRPKAPPASFGAAPAQGANLMLVPAWEPVAPSPVPAPAPSARTLIVGSLAGGARVLRERFPEAGKLPVRVGAGVDELAEALRRAGPIEHLVWAVPASAYRSMSDEALIEDQEQGVVFGLRLVQALLQLDYGARPLKWTVVTTQVCATRRNEPVAPGHASIHGLIGAMAKELPDWEVRLADVEANQAWPLDALLALPADPEGSPWAFRQGRWYRQQLVPTEAALDQDGIDLAEPYRHGGVYVVIGGAGGIGQAWSEFVAQRYQANIVWIGRTPADAAIEQKLDAVARRGPRPLYIAADARDRADLERAYRLIKARFPAIHGVVHSAIVLQDQSLATMSEQRLRAALSSKVDVSVRMAQVFGAEALDFAMFFSSIAAFTRVAGQSNYAAGCVFKDTFAHQLRQEWDCEVKVMNWGYWGTLGIAATPERTERMAREGIGSIRPDQAMDALTVLLSSAPDQMAFLTLAEAGEP